MLRSRDPILIGTAIVLLCAGIIGTLESISWIGKPFPGFLVLENKVVASAGLASWPATRGGRIYQYEILSADGRPVDDVAALGDHVASLPIGTPVDYVLRRGDDLIETRVETRRFGAVDFAMLFGAYWLCGVGIAGVALAIRHLRGRDQMANGTFFPLCIVALWSLTAMDLYGPYRLFRVHALCEMFLFGAMLHLALAFPSPAKWIVERPRSVLIPYALCAVLGLVSQLGLYSPGVYVATHLTATSLFGMGLIALIGAQVGRYLHTPSFETRQRIKIVALGTAAALGPQVVLALWSGATGGRAPQNVMAFTGVLFPISIAYAVLRHNLLGVDDLVRRSTTYAAFTGVIAVSYAFGLTAFDGLFRGSEFHNPTTFGLVFGAFSALVLLPMRDFLQQAVNRAFFRTVFDFQRIVESASHRLTSATEIDVISEELASAANAALYPEWTVLYVRSTESGPLSPIVSPPLQSSFLEALVAQAQDASLPLEDGDGHLAVPFRVDGKLIAVLLLGKRRSGRNYSGDDRRLLMTLANQAGIAIQNALALARVRRINAELESRVDERTMELNQALGDLQITNRMLTELSLTDPLTNLRNRAFVDDALEREFARSRRTGDGMALLMLDLDHFKQVNDRYGHQVGDAVLVRTAELIQSNLRTTDIAGRFGGEEFIVILANPDSEEGAGIFAERLRGSIEQEPFLDAEGERFSVTTSVGVASILSEHREVGDLLADADSALYLAKSRGRNRAEIHGRKS
jgi:diguanylate cyclase (GGDEF)-like protein